MRRARVTVTHLPVDGFGVKPSEPFAKWIESGGHESIEPLTPFAPLLEEPGLHEHGEVSCGRWPRVGKPACDCAGRDLAATHMNREQDLTPCRMRDRGSNGLQAIEFGLGVVLRHETSSASAISMDSITLAIGSHTAMTSGV